MPKSAQKPNAAAPRPRVLLPLFYGLPVLLVLVLCGYMGYRSYTHKLPPQRVISTAPFATAKIGALDAQFFAQGNTLRAAGNDLFIQFRDGQGKLTDVGRVDFELVLKMPGSIMHSIGKVLRTSTPGQYRTSLEPGLAGDWMATIRFSGQLGESETNFPVRVM